MGPLECTGILYLLVILAKSELSWTVIDNVPKKGENEEVSDVFYVFQVSLCFDMWINQHTFYPLNENRACVQPSTMLIQR